MTAHEYDNYYTHHQSRRLPGYDYTQPAAYFVTVCTHERMCLFGEVIDGSMRLNAPGRVVEEEWLRSEALRAEVMLDAFVVMPNHVHGIVVLVPPGTDPAAACVPTGYHLSVATQRAASLPQGAALPKGNGGRVNVSPRSVGAFVRAFKSAATRRINLRRHTPGARVWQPRYHDRILRNEREWHTCRRYIDENPARWGEDKHNPYR